MGPLPWIIVARRWPPWSAPLLFIGGYLAGGGIGGANGCAAPNESFAAFCEAYDRLQREHVDDLDSAKLAEGAIRGMFQYGVEDPFSGYMSPDALRTGARATCRAASAASAPRWRCRTSRTQRTWHPAPPSATSAASWSWRPSRTRPAEAAGLQAGDYVLAVDGESVDGSTVNDQVTKIRGEPGTDVTLTILRDDGEPFDLTITRDEIVIREVETRMIDGHIGYIALNGFSATASEQFAAGLSDLLDDGADQIVFDLRDNPGGYIEAAQQIASQFIDDGLIFTQESAGDDVREYRSTGDGVATDPRPAGRGARERRVGLGVGDRRRGARTSTIAPRSSASRPTARTRSRSGAGS